MDRDQLKSMLYEKYLRPTEQEREKFIGVEIEMPIVELTGKPTNQELAQRVFREFVEHFGFEPDAYDDNGVCHSATLRENGDNISFDCSYNNLELSLGKEREIGSLDKRFRDYVTFLNDKLRPEGHLLTGFGINPNYQVNSREFIPSERYRMLERFLKKSQAWSGSYPMYFHPYLAYGTFASASQVQIDVNQNELLDVINVFNLLEPVKAVIFSNSLITTEPDLLCVRDILWENSTHGINPHNVGMYAHKFEGINDLLEYLCSTSIFNVERGGKYIHFRPIPIEEYFETGEIMGEYFDGKRYQIAIVRPQLDDLRFLRTYKFEDLTFRGTIEFRSCCNQPFNEAMTVAAFHTGLMPKVQELKTLLENDETIYHMGYSVPELRQLFNKKAWPAFVDKDNLRDLILKVLDIAKGGLLERGYGEEGYIDPLIVRAQNLTSPGRDLDAALKRRGSRGSKVKEYVLKYSELD